MANSLKTAEKESNSFYEGDNFKPCLTKNSFKHNFVVRGTVLPSLTLGLSESFLACTQRYYRLLKPYLKNGHLRRLGIKSILNILCRC